jgi:hypothetical protein
MGLAFFGSFFGHAKNERPSGSDKPLTKNPNQGIQPSSPLI